MSKTLISPKGQSIYPRLNTPDTEYKTDGEYHAKMKFDSDEAPVSKWLEQIDAWYDEAFEKAVEEAVEKGEYKTAAVARKKIKRADKPYHFVEDDDGEDTNEVIINFRMHAKAKNRKTGEMFELKPSIFGANGILSESEIPRIGNGSILKIAYTPVFWYTKQLGASVKLRLEGAKIFELCSGGGNRDIDFGDDEGEGYVPQAGISNADFDGDDAEDDGSGDF